MMRWKHPASWALAIASALIMAAPARCEEFSPPPLAGNYVLVQSIPEVNMEAREFSQELFSPNQKFVLVITVSWKKKDTMSFRDKRNSR